MPRERNQSNTKLAALLESMNLSNSDLYYMIIANDDSVDMSRLSRIISGKMTNYHLKTARIIAKALGVSIYEVIDEEIDE